MSGSGRDGPADRGAQVPALDGLRGVSAQVVCLAHAAGLVLPETSTAAQVLGWLARVAVIVFFVISGFAITVGIARSRDQRGGHFDLLVYAIHRLARIYPPYLASLVLVWGLAAALALASLAPQGLAGEGVGAPGPAEVLRALVFAYLRDDLVTRLDGPLWSLRIEVVLYVLAACAAIAMDGAGPRRAVALAVAFALAAAMAWRLYFGLPAMLVFGAGGLAAALWRAGRRPPVPTDPLALVVAGLVALAAGPAVASGWLDLDSASRLAVPVQIGIGLAMAAFIWALAGNEGAVGRGLTRLRGLGGFAYTLYLVHVPLFILGASFLRAIEPNPSPALRLAWALVLLLAVEAVSLGLAAFLERPAWFRHRIGRVLGIERTPVRAGSPSG